MERTRNESSRLLTLGVLALGIVFWLAAPGTAEAVQTGEKAPDFKLPSTTGQDIRLSDYEGKSMVLIEFYHADFGPT